MAFWNIIIGLALMIIGYILMPKPKQPKQEITELEGPTAEAGRPIGVLFGDKRIKSPNYLGWWDKTYVQKKEKQKKK